MKKYLAAACAAFALGACATTISPEVQARIDQIGATASAPAAPSGALAITDQRAPEALRVREVPVGIAGGFSCNLGVSQLGDARFAADRIARLENALAAAFPDRASGASLIVRRYDVYLNHSAETNSQVVATGFGGGALAGAIAPSPDSASVQITRRPRCERERMLGGWFERADLTNNMPPITVEIDVNVFGRDYTVNSAFSPDLDLFVVNAAYDDEDPSLHRAAEAVLQQAMEKANTRLIERIRAASQ
jgi:hypothetical protein